MGSGLGKLGVLPVRVYISSFIHLDVLSAAHLSDLGGGGGVG